MYGAWFVYVCVGGVYNDYLQTLVSTHAAGIVVIIAFLILLVVNVEDKLK